MSAYVQAERPLRVMTPLGKDVLLLVGIAGEEGISRPFGYRLDVLAENEWDIPFDRVLGQKVTVDVLLPTGKRRFFNGICHRIAQGGRDKHFTDYRLEIVPQFALLMRRVQSRIFQHESVPDILKQVLAGLDVSFELQGKFEPRDCCVQYRESDFAFASRLMEEEGIFYFFKHSEGGHKMVLANAGQAHSDLPEQSTLIFEEVLGGLKKEDRVTQWRKSQELRSGKLTLWDHCFELPHLHLDADKMIPETIQVGKVQHKQRLAGNDKLELYDYPGAYAQRFDGVDKGGKEQPNEIKKIYEDNQRTVGIRMQQEAVRGLVIEGQSACRQVVSGHKFTLTRHFNADGPYVLTSVEHTAKLTGDFRSGETGEFTYENRFTCIPAAQAFRPQRTIEKPCVPGTQTAVVVGPAAEEIFTDKYGRVKVQFHWDRNGKHNADSSCWVRVGQPWAGKRWGASFWPRVGQEVIVDFLEGDPDQPIIVGSVYNADQMPPYLGNGLDPKHPNENKISGIKSNTTPGGAGYNEWRFDDTKGKEQVFVHAERNLDTRVKADEMETVGGSRHLTVGGEQNGCKMGDQKEKIWRDKHLHVHRDHREQVEGNMSLRVGCEGGNQDILVEATKKEHIKGTSHVHVEKGRLELVHNGQSLTVDGDRKEYISGAEHRCVHGIRVEQIDGGEIRHIGNNLTLKVDGELQARGDEAVVITSGNKIHLYAPEEIVLSVGAARIRIDGGGIKLDGPMIQNNCNPEVFIVSGPVFAAPAKPDQPADAEPAVPEDPAGADDSKSGLKSSPG